MMLSFSLFALALFAKLSNAARVGPPFTVYGGTPVPVWSQYSSGNWHAWISYQSTLAEQGTYGEETAKIMRLAANELGKIWKAEIIPPFVLVAAAQDSIGFHYTEDPSDAVNPDTELLAEDSMKMMPVSDRCSRVLAMMVGHKFSSGKHFKYSQGECRDFGWGAKKAMWKEPYYRYIPLSDDKCGNIGFWGGVRPEKPKTILVDNMKQCKKGCCYHFVHEIRNLVCALKNDHDYDFGKFWEAAFGGEPGYKELPAELKNLECKPCRPGTVLRGNQCRNERPPILYGTDTPRTLTKVPERIEKLLDHAPSEAVPDRVTHLNSKKFQIVPEIKPKQKRKNRREAETQSVSYVLGEEEKPAETPFKKGEKVRVMNYRPTRGAIVKITKSGHARWKKINEDLTVLLKKAEKALKKASGDAKEDARYDVQYFQQELNIFKKYLKPGDVSRITADHKNDAPYELRIHDWCTYAESDLMLAYQEHPNPRHYIEVWEKAKITEVKGNRFTVVLEGSKNVLSHVKKERLMHGHKLGADAKIKTKEADMLDGKGNLFADPTKISESDSLEEIGFDNPTICDPEEGGFSRSSRSSPASLRLFKAMSKFSETVSKSSAKLLAASRLGSQLIMNRCRKGMKHLDKVIAKYEARRGITAGIFRAVASVGKIALQIVSKAFEISIMIMDRIILNLARRYPIGQPMCRPTMSDSECIEKVVEPVSKRAVEIYEALREAWNNNEILPEVNAVTIAFGTTAGAHAQAGIAGVGLSASKGLFITVHVRPKFGMEIGYSHGISGQSRMGIPSVGVSVGVWLEVLLGTMRERSKYSLAVGASVDGTAAGFPGLSLGGGITLVMRKQKSEICDEYEKRAETLLDQAKGKAKESLFNIATAGGSQWVAFLRHLKKHCTSPTLAKLSPVFKYIPMPKCILGINVAFGIGAGVPGPPLVVDLTLNFDVMSNHYSAGWGGDLDGDPHAFLGAFHNGANVAAAIAQDLCGRGDGLADGPVVSVRKGRKKQGGQDSLQVKGR